MFFGRGSARYGRSTPILRKTQLDHDINLPPKFYQDRMKTHGAMLGTDRQTDIQTDRHTDKPAGDDGPILPPFYSTKARTENFLSPEKFL